MRESLYKEIEKFKNSWPVEEQAKSRVRKPDMPFYGEEILEMAVSAILAGKICYCAEIKLQEKIFWQKTLPGCLGVRCTTFPSM